jgi:hypothetical protein
VTVSQLVTVNQLVAVDSLVAATQLLVVTQLVTVSQLVAVDLLVAATQLAVTRLVVAAGSDRLVAVTRVCGGVNAGYREFRDLHTVRIPSFPRCTGAHRRKAIFRTVQLTPSPSDFGPFCIVASMFHLNIFVLIYQPARMKLGRNQWPE